LILKTSFVLYGEWFLLLIAPAFHHSGPGDLPRSVNTTQTFLPRSVNTTCIDPDHELMYNTRRLASRDARQECSAPGCEARALHRGMEGRTDFSRKPVNPFTLPTDPLVTGITAGHLSRERLLRI